MIFRVLPLLFALALSLGAPPASALSLPGFGPAKAKPASPAWAHEGSDLKPDPAVRFGRLANGMRYAIMRNTTPSNAVSLRLRFDAGSLDEAENERGLAHFIEHMAFNGSNRVREGEMIKILQRHGLAFGADTNASTSWDETVYQLDLPRPDDDTVATGLMLMRETAGNLTFDDAAINRERGVVLSEERTRDGPGLRVYQAGLSFFLKDQLAADRMPIGKVEVLKSAGREQMLSLYHRYYRPERAVLVVAGDVDPDAMETRIRATFADWAAEGPPGAEPVLGQPVKRGLDAKVVVEPGAGLSLQIAWLRPYNVTPDTSRARVRDLSQQLALAVLNRRLDRLTRSDAPPFIAGFGGLQSRFESAELTLLGASAQGAEWRPALEALVREQRSLAKDGVRPDELAREIVEFRESLRATAAQAASRRSEALANALIDSVGEQSVFTSPADELAEFERIVPALDARQISEAARSLFEGQGPLLLLVSPEPVEGGEATLRTAYRQAAGEKIAVSKAGVEKAWPYSNFGPPGAVVTQTVAAD
ncbi:MAG: M16 family metallopeptidase, partial [Caulobacteraceae bacterium]